MHAKELRLLDPQVSVGQDQSGGPCVMSVSTDAPLSRP